MRLRHEMEDDFAIHRGLENRAVGFQFIAQDIGVDQIPVMAERDLAAAQSTTIGARS